jgi:Family of unknown function (DUF5372)
VTHPVHPWAGRSFEFVAVRRTWLQDCVFFLLEDGTLTSVPTAWTDVAEPDVFVAVAAAALSGSRILGSVRSVDDLSAGSGPFGPVRSVAPISGCGSARWRSTARQRHRTMTES